VLGRFEAVGDQMEPVAFASQIPQDFQGIREEGFPGWQGIQEPDSHGACQRFVRDLEIQQSQPHPFPAKLIDLDETVAIALPQLIVVDQVAAVKFVKIRYAAFPEFQGLVKLFQGESAVRLKIPKRMVQVEKKVFILHAAKL
jgi:hypothetical protein